MLSMCFLVWRSSFIFNTDFLFFVCVLNWCKVNSQHCVSDSIVCVCVLFQILSLPDYYKILSVFACGIQYFLVGYHCLYGGVLCHSQKSLQRYSRKQHWDLIEEIKHKATRNEKDTEMPWRGPGAGGAWMFMTDSLKMTVYSWKDLSLLRLGSRGLL